MRNLKMLFVSGLLAGLGTALLPSVHADEPAAATAPAGEAAEGEIRFQFVQLKDRGVIRCALYQTPQDYMKKSFREVVGTVAGGRALCVFAHIKPGTYSLAAFHDENNNDKLDTGFLGIPTEGFCASNNAKGSMGPAKYKDAAFNVTGGSVSQELRMNYR